MTKVTFKLGEHKFTVQWVPQIHQRFLLKHVSNGSGWKYHYLNKTRKENLQAVSSRYSSMWSQPVNWSLGTFNMERNLDEEEMSTSKIKNISVDASLFSILLN
jgi:hypothetical protein